MSERKFVGRHIYDCGESTARVGYRIIEIESCFDDDTKIVDVYHVKTSNIVPNGKTIIWGKRKNGTFYIKRIEA